MKKTNKVISLLTSVIMLMQFTAISVSAQELEAYWGQSFPDEEWSFNTGEAVFWQRADISNFEFTLYKDNTEVYSNRIEEGSLGDETEGDWYGESIFLPRFAEYGSGAYKFTVSSLTGDGLDIDEAEVIETATSGTFNYTKPSATLAVPNIVSNENGVFDWEKSDDNTYAYMFDREVDFGNGVIYDPDYEESYCADRWQSEYDVREFEDTLDYFENYNPVKYPKANAKVKIRVRAMPEDITEYNPSDYTDWYTIDYKFTSSGNTEEPEELDRTVVSDSYYDAAKAVYDLGIMPDVYTNYAKTVTRGDFAVVLTKVTGLTETAEDLKDTKIFNDIETGTYLNGCANALYYSGYMSAVSNGVFGPDTEVIFQDVLKVLVDATGYKPLADNYQGYPTGYLYVASSKGINKGVTLAGTAGVTYEQLAQLIYNSLNTGIMKQVSWGYAPQYETTNNTLLYKGMGMEKFIGEVVFIDDTTAELTGFLYNKTKINGTKVTNKKVSIKDADILDYSKNTMQLYLDNDTVLSGFEYEGIVALVNNGDEKTSTRTVPVEVGVYNDVYTKFKVGSDGEYHALTDKAYALLGTADGTHNVTVYFADDDETVTTSRKATVSLVNKHTVTFMVNGKVYSTATVGCGAVITAPSSVKITGYEFEGWLDKPLAMPDKDIIVHGTATPTAVYKGKIVQNGEPVYASIYVDNSWKGGSNSSTGEFSFEARQGERVLNLIVDNVTKSVFINGTDSVVDLGEIELNSIITHINSRNYNILNTNVENIVLSDEDKEYLKTDGNAVAITLNADYVSSTAINSALRGEYADYTACLSADITITKTRTGAETATEKITETDELVEIEVDISTTYQGKKEYIALREHDGVIDVLTTTPNEDGEYIKVSGNTVTIYAKKFSPYSVICKGVATLADKYTAEVVQNDIDEVNVNVTMPEITNENAVLYVAFYDENGALIKALNKRDFEETNTFDAEYEAADIKAFIWDGLKPLT